MDLYEKNRNLFEEYVLHCKNIINSLSFNEKELKESFSIYKELLENNKLDNNATIGDAIKLHRLEMLDLKENHTLRVVDGTEKACTKIGVNKGFKTLAQLSALFHDIARFPQGITSNNFYDKECTLFQGKSHAEYGYKMLYIDKMLDDYQIPKEYHYAIAYAVLKHQENNSLLIQFDNLEQLNIDCLTGKKDVSKQELVILATLSQLVRDVDKIDILYQHLTNEFPVVRSFIKKEVLGRKLDDICNIYDVDKNIVKEYNHLKNDDISTYTFINIPSEYINLNTLVVPKDIKEVFFNNGFLDLKTLQKRDDYSFIVGMWWRLNCFLNDINFVANLELLKENNILEKIYDMFPPKYRFLVYDAFEFAKEEILDKKIKDNNGKIYVKR